MDAVLVNPPILIMESVQIPTRAHNPFEHMGLGYIGAVLRQAGYNVEIVDSYITPRSLEETADIIEERSPRLVGFSATHEFLTSAVKIGKILRDRGYSGHLTLGGYLPTFLHDTLLEQYPFFDSIVRGEGENAITKLMAELDNPRRWSEIPGLSYRLGKDVFHNSPGHLIDNLSALPHPLRDTLPRLSRMYDYAAISSSRGCPRGCTFCSIKSFYHLSPGPLWRPRSPEDVADEMETLLVNHHVGQLSFTDDNFLGPRDRGNPRAFAIGREILRRGLSAQFSILARVDSLDEGLLRFLKMAGLRSLFVGFESGVDRALKTFGKGITAEDNRKAVDLVKRLEIRCFPGFIMFDPYTTIEEVRQNLEFVDYAESGTDLIKIDDLLGSLQPFTGTPIRERLQKEGRLILPQGDLVPGDGIPAYEIADPRVEVLRRGMKAVRRNLSRPLFDSMALLERRRAKGEVQEQLLEEFDSLQGRFHGLVSQMRQFEKEYFREAIRRAEEIRSLTPEAHRPIEEGAWEQVRSINGEVNAINGEVEQFFRRASIPSS